MKYLDKLETKLLEELASAYSTYAALSGKFKTKQGAYGHDTRYSKGSSLFDAGDFEGCLPSKSASIIFYPLANRKAHVNKPHDCGSSYYSLGAECLFLTSVAPLCEKVIFGFEMSNIISAVRKSMLEMVVSGSFGNIGH